MNVINGISLYNVNLYTYVDAAKKLGNKISNEFLN